MQNINVELSESEMSEKNSCVLNVWTIDRKAKKPVMFWIHGVDLIQEHQLGILE